MVPDAAFNDGVHPLGQDPAHVSSDTVAAKYLPAVQLVQTVAPSAAEYLPAAQLVQIVAPFSEYRPAVQLLQSDSCFSP